MHIENQTIGQISESFAQKFNDFSAAYYARQLRHHVQLGVHAPYARTGEGRTAAALFRPDEVAMIRLVSVLARLGLPTNILADASKARKNTDRDEANEENADGIRRVMAAVAENEEWFFHLHIAAMQEGERGYGVFSRSRDVAPPALIADTIIGTIVLPCLPLLKPLVADA